MTLPSITHHQTLLAKDLWAFKHLPSFAKRYSEADNQLRGFLYPSNLTYSCSRFRVVPSITHRALP
jgi:hypothetical protein